MPAQRVLEVARRQRGRRTPSWQDRRLTLLGELPLLPKGGRSACGALEDAEKRTPRVQGGGGKGRLGRRRGLWPGLQESAGRNFAKPIDRTCEHWDYEPGDVAGPPPEGEPGDCWRVTDRVGPRLRRNASGSARGSIFDDLLAGRPATCCGHPPRKSVHRVAAGIDLLLVDEFQDTDPIQTEIVTAPVRRRSASTEKLFFVGDVKQSI